MRSMDDLLLRLLFLARSFRGFSKRHIVEIFLLEVGISAKKNSFNYLVDSILVQDSVKDSMITKDVYPEVAQQHNMDESAIEKAEARAIRCAWKTHDEKWNMYFPNNRCPTNAEFISTMAIILGFWEDCCKIISQKEGSECVS